MSSRCTPAARRWARRARWSPCPRILRDFMVNRGRTFIYSTAPSPLMAAAVRAALKIVAGAEQERAQLQALVRHAGDADAGALGLHASPARRSSPSSSATMRAPCALAEALQARGYDIRAIRPPTVPEGTARLRIALTLHADDGCWMRCSPIWPPSWRRWRGVTRFVVTGTDTGIGKTVFAAALAAALGARLLEAGAGGAGCRNRQRNRGAPVGRRDPAGSLSLQAGRFAASGRRGRRRQHRSGALIAAADSAAAGGRGGGRADGAADPDTLYIDVFARWKLPLILCARTAWAPSITPCCRWKRSAPAIFRCWASPLSARTMRTAKRIICRNRQGQAAGPAGRCRAADARRSARRLRRRISTSRISHDVPQSGIPSPSMR